MIPNLTDAYISSCATQRKSKEALVGHEVQKSIVKLVLSVCTFCFSLLGSASGQTSRPVTLTDLVKYAGPDRDRILFEGAKKEQMSSGIRQSSHQADRKGF